jgi:ubiquinone biosynthesis protein COQ9
VIRVETTLAGCFWSGVVDYDPGQPYPTAACGGVPPSTDVEIIEVDIYDLEELWLHGPFEVLPPDIEERILRVVTRRVEQDRPLHPQIAAYLADFFCDEVEDRLIEAYRDEQA